MANLPRNFPFISHVTRKKKKPDLNFFKFLSILNILMNYLSWDKIKFVYIYKSKLEIQNSLVFSFFFFFFNFISNQPLNTSENTSNT